MKTHQDVEQGDEVRVFDVNGKRVGQPDGGWPGIAGKAGPKLVVINYRNRLDERGIPVTAPGEMYARACPPKPCDLCTGDSAVVLGYENGKPVRLPSWDWCRQNKTCAATVDREGIYGYGR